jgi:hypothetical protein
MSTYYLKLNQNYVIKPDTSTHDIQLSFENPENSSFLIGDYQVKLESIGLSDSQVFVKTIDQEGIISFRIYDLTWDDEYIYEGVYNVYVTYYPFEEENVNTNNYTFILENNLFYICPIEQNKLIIYPSIFQINPNVANSKKFDLYRLSNLGFQSDTYHLELSSLSNFFNGSTSTNSQMNPINITIDNINLQYNDENYILYAVLNNDSEDFFEIINYEVEIQTLCFLEGTKILNFSNEYISIERIEPCTLIKTYGSQPFLPVKCVYKTRINYKKKNNKLNKLFKYDNKKFGLTDDLIVSGGHSILVDDLNDNEKKLTKQFWNKLEKIENKYKLLACIDSRNSEFEEEGIYNMYQIVLYSHDKDKQFAIYANGMLSETMSINFYKSHTSNI